MAPRSPIHEFVTGPSEAGPLLAALRQWMPDLSWSQARAVIRQRRVTVERALCLNESRKLRAGETVRVYADSLPAPPTDEDVRVLFCDRFLVIVEKPARMVTLRHRAEIHWPSWRKRLQPTLDEVVPRRITHPKRQRSHGPSPVFPVHRIDRDTSGLLVFARSEEVRDKLVEQFAERSVVRVYRTIVPSTIGAPCHSGAPGKLGQRTFRSQLVRDRGDGLRGSTTRSDRGYAAVTHIRPVAALGTDYCELECRLETGRTHQIRIHVAEAGHPVCGDYVYRGPFGEPPIPDHSGAPRLALHAAQLGLIHPMTGQQLHFETSWPADMERFRRRLQESSPSNVPLHVGRRP